MKRKIPENEIFSHHFLSSCRNSLTNIDQIVLSLSSLSAAQRNHLDGWSWRLLLRIHLHSSWQNMHKWLELIWNERIWFLSLMKLGLYWHLQRDESTNDYHKRVQMKRDRHPIWLKIGVGLRRRDEINRRRWTFRVALFIEKISSSRLNGMRYHLYIWLASKQISLYRQTLLSSKRICAINGSSSLLTAQRQTYVHNSERLSFLCRSVAGIDNNEKTSMYWYQAEHFTDHSMPTEI